MNVETNGSAAACVGPRVHFNAKKRMWQGKAKVRDKWTTKAVPVDLQDERKAQDWFDAWYSQTMKAGFALPNQEVVQAKTLRGLAPKWIADGRERYPGDAKQEKERQRTLEAYVFKHRIADLDIEKGELEIGDVVDWIGWLQQRPNGSRPKTKLSAGTVRNIVQAIRGFVVDARGKGWVKTKENPFLDPYLKRVLPKIKKGDNVYLATDVACALIKHDCIDVPDTRRMRHLLAIATGMRKGELVGLLWDHVDLDRGVIRVFSQSQRNGTQWVTKDPKKDSHRLLPLHPTALAALRWWKEKGWFENVGRRPQGSDVVLCDLFGNMTATEYPNGLRIALERAGLPTKFEGKPFNFHALRKTFATMLEDANVSQTTRDVLMGHGAKGVGDKHYVGKNIKRFADAVALLPLPAAKELSWLR